MYLCVSGIDFGKVPTFFGNFGFSLDFIFFQWEISYMNDNCSLDKYLYILTVYTGLSRQARTTSNVMFMVIDVNGQTTIRRLEGGKHQVYINNELFNLNHRRKNVSYKL